MFFQSESRFTKLNHVYPTHMKPGLTNPNIGSPNQTKAYPTLIETRFNQPQIRFTKPKQNLSNPTETRFNQP